MALGRPKIALILTDEERVRLDSLAHRSRSFLTCAILMIVLAATNVFAQDRVILFEPFILSANGTFLPGQIREIQITQGGRAWSQVRSIPLSPHADGPPVALADGSRIAWLAVSGNTTVVVQYNATTARASIVDIGVFDRGASLVSDPATPRLYVIEPRPVTFIDYRLQPTTIELSGTKTTISAQATGSHLILHRRAPDEVVVIDPQTAATINVIPIDEFAEVRVSRTGRLYTHYNTVDIFRGHEQWFAARALSTGALITRTPAPHVINFFEVDDSRGVLVHQQTNLEWRRSGIIVRDAASLVRRCRQQQELDNGRRESTRAQSSPIMACDGVAILNTSRPDVADRRRLYSLHLHEVLRT
jgi:hypothetical protein